MRDAAAQISSTADGFIDQQTFQLFRDSTVKNYSTPYEAIAAVLKGTAQAYLGDTVSTLYLLNQSFNNLLVTNTSVNDIETGIGLAYTPDNARLASILDGQLFSHDRCQIIKQVNWWVAALKCRDDAAYQHPRPCGRSIAWPPAAAAYSGQRRPRALRPVRHPRAVRRHHVRYSGTGKAQFGAAFRGSAHQPIHQSLQFMDKGEVYLGIISQTATRERKYLFTRPIINTPYALITRSDAPEQPYLTAGTTHSIALPESDALINYVRGQFPSIALQLTDNVPDALKSVSNGDGTTRVSPGAASPSRATSAWNSPARSWTSITGCNRCAKKGNRFSGWSVAGWTSAFVCASSPNCVRLKTPPTKPTPASRSSWQP
ncbi:transporter substrate-binding domain-containing protein [Pseudomonas fluorescens]|uniref:transporter substrate-binding domain-containing protein n=1 Tax=Pseudomonas fluorescens TaxID=294 RepID=UPI00124290B0